LLSDTTHALATNSFPSPSRGWGPNAETLLTRFNTNFETLTADSAERTRLAQKIRYQVYCIENPLEKCGDNPDGVERDEFDSHAVHSLLFDRSSQTALGTVRMILPVADAYERSFAVQRLLNADAAKALRALPIHSMAEVSRFSISRQFRRNLGAGPNGYTQADVTVANSFGPLMRLGLIQGLVRMSMQCGITHWCALMEPTLLRMLGAMAIRFRPIGPMVEFRGMRQPCCINVHDMLNAVMCERPAFWDLITDGGSFEVCTAAA
jgi:N-acyl amino acid synthase of PEP-CTERM/exosortase system